MVPIRKKLRLIQLFKFDELHRQLRKLISTTINAIYCKFNAVLHGLYAVNDGLADPRQQYVIFIEFLSN